MSIAVPADPRASTVYVDWVESRCPADVPAAEAVLVDVAQAVRFTYKPGPIVDVLRRSARKLPADHLPWFWDTAGHRLLEHCDDSRLGKRFRKVAAAAFSAARLAETEHGLPVVTDYRVRNALLFASAGAMPTKEIAPHRQWLSDTLTPVDAHRELGNLLVALSRGGAPLAASLAGWVRTSARAAGLGDEEQSRLLLRVLTESTSGEIPDGLLDAAARVFAKAPPTDPGPALALLPRTRSDGAALLRMLDAAGAVDAVAAGTATPPGGCAAWMEHFYATYCYKQVPGGAVTAQRMPTELLRLAGRWGERLRADGTAVDLTGESRFRHSYIDVEFVDALMAEHVSVKLDNNRRLKFWDSEGRRALRAFTADPALADRLEAVLHEMVTGIPASAPHRPPVASGSALTVLPDDHGLLAPVRARVLRLRDRVAHGGLLDAEKAAAALDSLLDAPTVRALDGLEEELAGLDGVGPLLCTLRAGIPDEWHWPAYDAAITELGEVRGVTATWPILTLSGTDRAIAVDHRGPVADTRFTVPAEALDLVVFFAGGDFLVAYRTGGRNPEPCDTAFWASAPHTVFRPDHLESLRGSAPSGLGYQFASADGSGRHDGSHLLHPGDRHGVGRFVAQLCDGTTVWSAVPYGEFAVADPHLGSRGAAGLPSFFTEPALPEGHQLRLNALSLAVLPEGVTGSPLGDRDAMVGFRVSQHGTDRDYQVTGVDGRQRSIAGNRVLGSPWGIVSMPGDGATMLVDHWSGPEPSVTAYLGDEAMWKVSLSPNSESPNSDMSTRVLPPPAFWHFLTARDENSSRALRALDQESARELVADGLIPAGVSDRRLSEAMREHARRASALTELCERIRQRIADVRGGSRPVRR